MSASRGPAEGRLAYLGLGSNIGDRRDHLQAAVYRLAERGIEVRASSSLYETEPVGLVLDQPEFLNACLQISTPLGPEELLDACKQVERVLGRVAGGARHGPRVVDVDLLLLGAEAYSSERLSLPHPEVSGRRFVLVPLLELEPSLELPDGTRLSDLLGALGEGQQVRRAGPPLRLAA
ncbi:MAG: 2-amino-4-hydroxy-6-hydroxymethyldihydropteridine diphosphokinase [Solirubrobacteraceae bacterium]